jgi:hypothetical protein
MSGINKDEISDVIKSNMESFVKLLQEKDKLLEDKNQLIYGMQNKI